MFSWVYFGLRWSGSVYNLRRLCLFVCLFFSHCLFDVDRVCFSTEESKYLLAISTLLGKHGETYVSEWLLSDWRVSYGHSKENQAEPQTGMKIWVSTTVYNIVDILVQMSETIMIYSSILNTVYSDVSVSKLLGNLHIRFRSINFFTAPCPAGSFSPTGLAPCSLCDRRSFQPRNESRVCFSCPGTTITLKPGSKNSQDCLG